MNEGSMLLLDISCDSKFGEGGRNVSKEEQLALGEFYNLPCLGHGCIFDLI